MDFGGKAREINLLGVQKIIVLLVSHDMLLSENGRISILFKLLQD